MAGSVKRGKDLPLRSVLSLLPVNPKWLYPGMGVKRWVLLLAVGALLAGLGAGYVLADLYRTAPFPPVFYYLTLQFIPRLMRGALFLSLGGIVAMIGLRKLTESVVDLVAPQSRDLAHKAYTQRYLARRPKIVAIGGGTGLSTLLRGLKEHTANLTAIVTVADDGGSSGRLRNELGVLPMGDLRQCIAALADAEPLMTRLLEYRFNGTPKGSGLDGHSFGNLLLAAMTGICGDFDRAVKESSRVLAVRGQVLPATLDHVTLCAELDVSPPAQSGSAQQSAAAGSAATSTLAPTVAEGRMISPIIVRGESRIPEAVLQADPRAGGAARRACRIKRVFLDPEAPAAYPEAVQAIREADMIVLGPGSLYTSVLPNLLVPELCRAVRESAALRVYVANVATQPGETDGYDAAAHLAALHENSGGPGLVDIMLVNNNTSPEIPEAWGVSRVLVEEGTAYLEGVRVVTADIVDEARPTRHDPAKLANVLMRLAGGRA